jgi:hypothetical protein
MTPEPDYQVMSEAVAKKLNIGGLISEGWARTIATAYGHVLQAAVDAAVKERDRVTVAFLDAVLERRGTLSLHIGEMTAAQLRTAKAVVTWLRHAIKRGEHLPTKET